MSGSLRNASRSHPRISRHLEGWELGALTVGIALVTTWLVMPRAVPPDDLPIPTVNRQRVHRRWQADAALAQAARQTPLPYSVRAVGESLRHFGALEATHEPTLAGNELVHLHALVQRAWKQAGSKHLRQLEALQTELWLSALRRFEVTGHVDSDLSELGGLFISKARASGWVVHGRLKLNDSQRRVVFRMRWLELTRLRHAPDFLPRLDDWRVYYGLLIARPEAGSGASPVDIGTQRLRYIDALSHLDPAYPGQYARGIVLFRLGRYTEAANAFSDHLHQHPNGSWTLRARNFFVAAAERARLQQLERRGYPKL